MKNRIVLGNITVDCKDARRLADFYAALLDGTQGEMFGFPTVQIESGVKFLFVPDAGYVPPVWPEEAGKQQKQAHFDFLVADLEEDAARAERLGAVKTAAQYGGELWVTLLDPAGHPFCLCRGEE